MAEFSEQTQGGRESGAGLDEISELQERLARIDSLIQQATELAVQQAGRAGEIQAALEAATSEVQLPEGEVQVPRKASGPGELEQGVAKGIEELESQLREKQELVESHDAELNELRSKFEEASALAAAQAEQTVELQQRLEGEVAALKSELAEKEETLRQKDLAMKHTEESLTGLEESLVNQIRILEDQLEEMVRKAGPEATETEPGKKRKAARKSPKQGSESADQA
ncbi:MAG: hypothetical protein HYV05_12710 [Deltaproteobacteria bacterium]|nr:hypothetical protein [Deltaproteobacteria bacterium]